MADQRRSQRDFSEAKRAARHEDMQRAIAQGRLIVRQMTPQERAASDVRFAAASARAVAHKKRHAS
jgi:hypothetical protein